MKQLQLVLYFITTSVFGQTIIPQPAVIKPERGSFTIREGLRVWASPSCANERQLLNQYWQEAGLPALANATKSKAADIRLVVDGTRYEALGQEGYELVVSPRRVLVAGASGVGVFHGLQTLRQLLPEGTGEAEIPALLVRDKPRFSWRMFRLDEARERIGIATVKKLLDELTLLKFNRFHWRIPQTNNPYTSAQIDQIRQYAQERRLKLVVESEPVSVTAKTQYSPDYDVFRSPETDTTTLYFWKGGPKPMVEAVQRGWQIVNTVCAETCLDKPLSELPLARTYAFDPIPDQLLEDLRPQILGVGYTYQIEETASPFARLRPRLAAAAEVAWTFQQDKNWNRFQQSLIQFERKWW